MNHFMSYFDYFVVQYGPLPVMGVTVLIILGLAYWVSR